MRNKKFLPSLYVFLCLGLVCAYWASSRQTPPYPHFSEHPHLDKKARALMTPYLLPVDHPIKATLDTLFSKTRVIATQETLLDAGFSIIAAMPISFVIVARHPDVPGYVFKLYLDSETRTKKNIPHHEWLTRRCIGAATIRKLILEKHLRHFTVPDKWLYVLPVTSSSFQEPVVVVETDMQLGGEAVTRQAWKTLVTPQHLDELYTILKQGYGTTTLGGNVHYTKSGLFAFTDTEYPQRKLRLRKVRSYLSEEMQRYWNHLTGNRDSKVKGLSHTK